MSDTEKASILEDWERARHYICFLVSMKTGPWRLLPLIVTGLSHHIVSVARDCAIRMLALFDLEENLATLHPLVLLLCAPGERGRSEVLAFIAGTGLAELPFLRRAVARFKFIVVVERLVESLRKTSSVFGPPRPSCRGDFNRVAQRSCSRMLFGFDW